MNDSFDLNSPSFLRSLAETVAWCESQPITAIPEETEDLKHRRRLRQQSNELANRARKEGTRFWNRLLRRHYTNSALWQRAIELEREAGLSSYAPLNDQLRTLAFLPTKSFDEARTEHERNELVRGVIEKRSESVRLREQSTHSNTGRLLEYAPDENLADGAAQVSSSGFFDVDNVPPWDTWVMFSGGILISWVPLQLIALAQAGIDVNPEECIRWADRRGAK